MAHKPTERVLDILKFLSVTPKGLTLTELSEASAVPKSTLYPIMQTMLIRKFVSLEKSSLKYKIGIAAFSVGLSYSKNKYILDFIKKIMVNIVSQINETCQMGILDENNVVYILREDPVKESGFRLVSHIGTRIPAYCTALGKALLSEYEIEKIKELYPAGLKAVTKKTVTDFAVLEDQLKTIRKTQIAKEFEEVTEFLCCFAVPLISSGKTFAAISISIPSFRANEEKINLATTLLLQAKEQIEATSLNIDADSVNNFRLND